MTTHRFSIPKGTALRRMGFASALICGLATFAPLPALSQDSAAQRLSDTAVEQQVPQAFPDPSKTPAVQTTPATQKTPETQKTPPSNQQQTAAPSQTVQETANGDQSAVKQTSAVSPAAESVPAQPEERKLVPATAMGTAAQNVENGQGNGQDDAAANLPNPVEDSAADMESQAASGLPDALEKYSTRAREAEEMQGASEEGNDSLPKVNNTRMLRLETEGFDNANKVVSVAVGGADTQNSAELQEEIRTEAFDAAITGMFPLTPDQIEGLIKRYDKTQKAATKPPYDEPKPEISVQNISLDPGMPPPVIKTAVGNVTTINMLDATGAPWPVQDVTWAGDYEIVEPEEGGHIVRITPMSHFARGNIVIRLLTLKTPLTMTLETGRDVVQYRVDARIPEYGPFANAPLMQGAKSTLVAGSPDLTSLLDGVMPGGMEKLEVAGVDGRTTAYTGGGVTYVRTPLTLLSPAWKSSVSSADGMNVYALTNAPVLLLSDGGEFQRATLKEKEDLLDE